MELGVCYAVFGADRDDLLGVCRAFAVAASDGVVAFVVDDCGFEFVDTALHVQNKTCRMVWLQMFFLWFVVVFLDGVVCRRMFFGVWFQSDLSTFFAWHYGRFLYLCVCCRLC